MEKNGSIFFFQRKKNFFFFEKKKIERDIESSGSMNLVFRPHKNTILSSRQSYWFTCQLALFYIASVVF